MKFNKNGRKESGTQKTIENHEEIYFGLESEHVNISSNAIDIARDMVHEKRIPKFLILINHLELSFK